MIKTITAYDLERAFHDADRDYFSYDGLQTLLDYYDEIDPAMELDVVGICCDCSEYGDGAALDLDDMMSEFGHLLDDETAEDEELDLQDKCEKLAGILDDHTTVLRVRNGGYVNYIVFNF